MKLTILGTGNATVTKCYNTCFVLSDGDRHFLVDAGGGNQILGILDKVDVPLQDIHDIFITHEHIDHLLGLIWLIRMIGQKMNQGKYEGDVRIYCHSDLVPVITTITGLTIQKKVTKHIGERIQLIPLESGDTKKILDCDVTFFDIGSTKAKQFGFTLTTKEGVKLSCCGDEPYNPCEEEYVKGSDWLMHEAFCLFGEADKFKPYEKHHSTVKEACQLAEELKVPNLILYHTEETHLAERKKLYTKEGQEYYRGNLYVPDDGDVFEVQMVGNIRNIQ
ncbi:MBL fold metallo-hydrolase [Faecalicatena orotica]|uniref:Ribonuclease Z n=1 Tax=Faecalicatena orotica TaxID=1544 RepID=A0A2Y9C5Q0_9FIRM|nr:MBL fold metallo-hydrolase [Faecalicatena orotica]PWJ28247.1 ribonuclease Z [Faecalicatena orotica]SSA56702.1 ribonuclease Z [Faecalicatena orotica]